MVKLYEHPDVATYSAEYTQHKDIFEGVRDTLTTAPYLTKHPVEGNKGVPGSMELLEIRKSLTQYTNFAKMIFNRYVALMFKSDPQVDDTTKEFFKESKFLEDVDGQGTSFVKFIKKSFFKDQFIYGKAAIQTDAPSGYVKNKDEQAKLGLRPYWSTISPLSIRDWGYASGDGLPFKKLEFIRTQYNEIEPRKSSTIQPKTVVKSAEYILEIDRVEVRYFTKNEAQTGQGTDAGSWNAAGNSEISLKEIPIVVTVQDDSLLKEPAPAILKYLNLDSSLMMGLLNQAHQRIIAFGEPTDPDKPVHINHATLTYLRGAEGVQVIEGDDKSALLATMTQTRSDIFSLAFNNIRTVAADSKAVQSAEGQDSEREELISMIKSMLDTIEGAINKALKHAAMFMGNDSLEPKINLDKNITIDDLNRELEIIALMKAEMTTYPKWKKAQAKRFVQMIGYANEQEILDEVEAAKEQTTPERKRGELDRVLNGKAQGPDPKATDPIQ